MTDTTPLYALPLPTPFRKVSKPSGKRKRDGKTEQRVRQDEFPSHVTEYSAVITPEERTQRRLAGQPVDEQPPVSPFPHAALPKDDHESALDHRLTLSSTNPSHSLRVQHLAAMTALLHRCLETRDYRRASRALALISRTEIQGKTIDLRHAGLWGIGAEILLRTHPSSELGFISRQGFEKAKAFYDKMAVQNPWNTSWPHVVNAQDFKLAMFGLWIYVVCHEAKRLQSLDLFDSARSQEALAGALQSKRWELAEAERVAQEMDSLMSTLPFMDDQELIRLRGMVALWIADLLDALDQLEAEAASNVSLHDQEMERAWLGLDEEERRSDSRTSPQSSQKAMDARNLAKAMFVKIGLEDEDDSLRANNSNSRSNST